MSDESQHKWPKVRSLEDLVVCPRHALALAKPGGFDSDAGMPWPDGESICPEGCRFPVIAGVPRFIPTDDYAAAFGLQWSHYRRTQLDSYTGVPLSRIRLERCLGMPLEALAGRSVLEVGSGAGRFTELLIRHSGALVSMDMSSAVHANLQNCHEIGPYALVQANLLEAPLRKASFDVVICLGVVQHTPDPEETIRVLASYLAPGGLLVIDHYASTKRRFGAVLSWLTLHWVLRAIAKRLSPDAGLRFTIAFTAISDPIRRITCRYGLLDQIVARVFCTACYYRTVPELPPEICREWNELDTHDAMTDWYQHKRSIREIERCLVDLDLVEIWCADGERGGNGIEARARRRQDPDSRESTDPHGTASPSGGLR